jgi:hypothetical protein
MLKQNKRNEAVSRISRSVRSDDPVVAVRIDSDAFPK